MNKKIIQFSLFVVLLFATLAFSQEEYDVKVTQLTDNLFLLIPQVYVAHPTIIASIGPDGVLLVDTGIKETAQVLKKKLDSLGNGNPNIIINTHAHIDHTGGNAFFGDSPTVIAHNILRKRLKSSSFISWEFPDATLPDILIYDSLTIFFNGEEISIIPFEGSHSDNDVIVFFKKSRIAFIGDIMYGFGFPSYDKLSGDVLKYPDVLEKVINYLPEDARIIPGHGHECNLEEFRGYHNILSKTIEAVSEAAFRGRTLEQMQEDKILNAWDSLGQGEIPTNKWIESIVYCLDENRPRKSLVEPLYLALKNNGIDGAVAKFHELKRTAEKEYAFTLAAFNIVTYYLLDRERYEDARKIQTLASEEYPDSWVVFYMLGEIYSAEGDKENARKYFKKSIEIDANNPYISELERMIKEL
ncbi:MAG: MBL fold metallo-hydrolase [candidate division Zixibacteria bacterium]